MLINKFINLIFIILGGYNRRTWRKPLLRQATRLQHAQCVMHWNSKAGLPICRYKMFKFIYFKLNSKYSFVV